MSTNTKKSRKRLPVISLRIIFVIFIVVAVISILEITNVVNIIGRNNHADTKGGTSNVEPLVNNIDYGPPKPEDTITSPEKSSIQNQTTDPLDTNKITVNITRANRNSVGVYIEKLNGGTCTLSIIQAGIEKINKSADVISQTDYSTCEGFDIDSSKLDSSPFTVKITVSFNGRTGVSTQEVN